MDDSSYVKIILSHDQFQPALYKICSLYRNTQARYVGVSKDKTLDVFTVAGKWEEIRDHTLSSTEPSIRPEDLNGTDSDN